MEKVLVLLQRIFKSKLSLRAKVGTLKSCVMPVLSYGAETWALTRKQVNDMKKTQRAMERRLIGTRKVKN